MDDTRDAVDKPNLWSEDEVYIFGEIMLTWEGDKVQAKYFSRQLLSKKENNLRRL